MAVLNFPTVENTVDQKTIVITRPIMVRKEKISEMFGISSSTVRRYLDEAEQMDEFKEDLYYQPAHNITIVDVDMFRKFLKYKHKKYL